MAIPESMGKIQNLEHFICWFNELLTLPEGLLARFPLEAQRIPSTLLTLFKNLQINTETKTKAKIEKAGKAEKSEKGEKAEKNEITSMLK
jgi:hypothetical protein